jgi:hypothetical protein
MAEHEPSTGPIDFSASFPPDARYASMAADLASKLAQTGGCGEQVSGELHERVAAAFERGAGGAADRAVELVLRLTSASLETVVISGGETLLRLTHSRPV